LKTARWTHWDIDLSAASLAPSSIKTVTLGLAGGSGTLYVDDVRLCPAAPPEPALVGYFPFDGDMAAITDAAGGDSGSKSMGAAKFVNTAKLGAQALLLDGSGGAIGSDAGFPAGNADVTFSLWFKDETPGVGVLFGYGNPTSSNLGSVHGFYFNTAYTCRYFHQAFKDVPFNAAATYDPAKWHHVVCVHDGTSEYIYWDGKQVTVIRGGQSMNVALRQWTMGINVGGSGYGYSGLLDDVAVWNYGLSDADIARLWNNGTGLPADKL